MFFLINEVGVLVFSCHNKYSILLDYIIASAEREHLIYERISVVIPPSMMIQEITIKETRPIKQCIGNAFYISLAKRERSTSITETVWKRIQ